jgi:hypothetical protein
VRVRNASSINVGDFTAEEITNGTMSAALIGDNGFIRDLFNQGSAGSWTLSQVGASSPRIAISGSPIIFNAMTYVDCTPNSSSLVSPQFSSANTRFDNNITVYIVYRSQSAVEQGGIISEERVSNNQDRCSIVSDTRGVNFNHTIYRPDSTATNLQYAAQQSTDTLRVVAYRRTGNTVEAFDENGLVASATNSQTFSGTTLWRFARQDFGSQPFNGHIGVVIVREQSDSNSTLNDIFDFLKTEYGI